MLLEKKCFRCAKAFYTCGESFVGSWKKKTFEREELNVKVLKSLNRTWQSKITTILESEDLSTMKVATLLLR